jgi:hypothetical protein
MMDRNCWMTEKKCPKCGGCLATDGDNSWCVSEQCAPPRLAEEDVKRTSRPRSEIVRPSDREIQDLIKLVDHVNRYLRLAAWGDLKVSSNRLAYKASLVADRLWKVRSNNDPSR